MKKVLQFITACTLFVLACTMQGNAQGDHNFRFFPSDDYRLDALKMQRDTVTGKMAWVQDTAVARVRCIVEKNDGRLTVYNTTDLTTAHYESAVKYLGFADDGLLSLMYRGAQNEIITVNPSAGFVTVTMMGECEPGATPGSPQRCATTTHTFGRKPRPTAPPAPK